jgi:hypothetical protein
MNFQNQIDLNKNEESFNQMVETFKNYTPIIKSTQQMTIVSNNQLSLLNENLTKVLDVNSSYQENVENEINSLETQYELAINELQKNSKPYLNSIQETHNILVSASSQEEKLIIYKL